MITSLTSDSRVSYELSYFIVKMFKYNPINVEICCYGLQTLRTSQGLQYTPCIASTAEMPPRSKIPSTSSTGCSHFCPQAGGSGVENSLFPTAVRLPNSWQEFTITHTASCDCLLSLCTFPVNLYISTLHVVVVTVLTHVPVKSLCHYLSLLLNCHCWDCVIINDNKLWMKIPDVK